MICNILININSLILINIFIEESGRVWYNKNIEKKEIREENYMGNFAVAASEEVIRQGNELLNELSKDA